MHGFMDNTKDNKKARMDLAQLCNRPPLELTTSGRKELDNLRWEGIHRGTNFLTWFREHV
jgi:hypothetical protein